MSDGLHVRVAGRAGRITLDRQGALNALSHDMVRAIDAALAGWAEDQAVALVVIDAAGDRAFCAGGDVTDLHAAGRAGDLDHGRRFWRDEYRMNARIAEYPKPVVTLMQGFTMGGGVGLGCHASHRVVDATSRIAMPEVGIGMLPDVGGTLLLARAPGHLGEFLGLTAHRMDAGDAIHAGFADVHVEAAHWPELIARLETTGEVAAVDAAATPAPGSALAAQRAGIDRLFGAPDLAGICAALTRDPGDLAARARAAMARHAPLAMACAVEAIRRMRGPDRTIRDALDLEYRFAHRVIAEGDFLEGVRAQIIDKDRAPRWRHAGPEAVSPGEVAGMLAPVGDAAVRLK